MNRLRNFHRLSRRSALQVGSLSAPGLSLPGLLRSTAAKAETAANYGPSFGRAKNIIFLYLAGGPPQHETFDPKPDAPEGIRGPFKPISTTVPGTQFCELLPRTAALADKLSVIRSMATDDNVHSSSGAWVLTGSKYRGPNARTISETDWPYFGSIVKLLRPSENLPALSTVWLPDVMRLNDNVTPAGQTAGFLGTQWNPEVFVGDPAAANYEIESLKATDVSAAQMLRRQQLLSQLEQQSRPANDRVNVYNAFQQQAFELLTSGKARKAFKIGEESTAVRERYGKNRWGQCVLMARRLVEAGVRLVHVQWPREPGDNAVDNPLWDTHAQNADRLEDVLCPMFDVGYSALLEDLDQRGLLDETLVVTVGEFGRTPKINAKGGRDHWGSVFSCALAGAGIAGGQIYGASDKDGAYPISNRTEPGDLTATMFHLLGMDYQGSFSDVLGRKHRLTNGEPIWDLLGDTPADLSLAKSSGDITRVPPYDPARHLLHSNFNNPNAVQPLTAPSRPKSWRANPILLDARNGFGIRLQPVTTNVQHAAVGFHNLAKQSLSIAPSETADLTQEVRSPFAGTYTLTVRLRGEASSQQVFEQNFRNRFGCRLSFFQFKSQLKKPDERTELATKTIELQFSDEDAEEWQSVELTKRFANSTPGANFSFGSGMGILIQVAHVSKTPTECTAGEWAHIRIADVKLNFTGINVNDKVTV